MFLKKLKNSVRAVPGVNRWQPRKHKILIIVCLVITGFLLAVGLVVKMRMNSPGHYYKNQLQKITDTVAQINPTTNLTNDTFSDIKKNLDRYDKLMANITSLCDPLIHQDSLYASKTRNKKMLEIIQNSKQLCLDLTTVAVYSQKVYRGSENFIELNPKLPGITSPEYPSRLNELSEIIQKTNGNLKNIDNSRVNDPGLEELLTHISDADKQIILIRASLEYNDNTSAIQQSNTLAKLLQDDKIHFLSARSYFWNNTVGVGSLESSLKKLLSQI